jgi:hypothetical protein
MEEQENLSEDMNRRLNQNTRRGAADASAKPNLAEREKLDRILHRVGNHMTVDEIDILYRWESVACEQYYAHCQSDTVIP